jgi:hypothetical protein
MGGLGGCVEGCTHACSKHTHMHVMHTHILCTLGELTPSRGAGRVAGLHSGIQNYELTSQNLKHIAES